STPTALHWILLALSCVMLLMLVIKPGNKYVQSTLFFSEIASCLLDETRWQPWEYLYLFILVIFILNRYKSAEIAACLVIILATVYVYSGLHKFNESFITNMWQTTILKRFFKAPPVIYKAGWMHYSGYLLPVIETVAGLGLLFSKTKKVAAGLLLLMHIFILLLIGPIGLHYNKIVWPWNTAMIALLYFLVIRNEKLSINRWSLFDVRNKIILTAWAILPAFNFIGFWDNYLSWNLYSSSMPGMIICIKDTAATTQLSNYYSRNHTSKMCNGNALLNIQYWALKEMAVPPYPEERVYKIIEAQWNTTYPLAPADFVIFYSPFKKDSASLIDQ
ncbi:MAG: MauE/DoxX family redox-associated membrane protein, partial [Ferruginibacter sp.]